VDEEAIFAAALECATPEARRALVKEVCAGDAKLEALVVGLLQAHDHPDSFLQAPGTSFNPTIDAPAPECAGTVIGPYKLIEQIGEGGFGVVFMAEQQQPVRRLVAIKVLKPGMDTRQVIARFEAERQALALMDHPNIAHVLEAGETASGRPYFVMELVRGLPITEFCDQNKLDPRKRLELFISVCQAVQHAHQKGIIHRDIKPSNVLVTLHDCTPVVKIIDFGISKALGQQLTEKTLVTGFAQMIGTPLYMSPEQAKLSGLDIDTRSDIYSLGVLLYELLTGTTPFEKKRLHEAGYDEMRRIIREDEPPKPSTRLSTLGKQATTVSEQRQSDPRRLTQLFRGELDWIVMKALEKDRNRRYESASTFAADIQRHLKDEPVEARPPSSLYKLGKFARRYKKGLVTAALLSIALVAVAGSLGWIAHDWQARRTEAEIRVVEALKTTEQKLPEGNPSDPELISAVRLAEAHVVTGVVHDELRRQVEEVSADLKMLAKLDEIRLAQSVFADDGFDIAGADAAYTRAFREYGIDVDALSVEEAAAQIRHRRAIGVHLAAALDNWAWARNRQGETKGSALPLGPPWQRLLRVAQAADPDRWRSSLREALAKGKEGADELKKLAASASIPALPATTLLRFAATLANVGAVPSAVNMLRQGHDLYPVDFWINYELACLYCFETQPHQFDLAIGHCRVALAARPKSPAVFNCLGIALASQGKLVDAVAAFRTATKLNCSAAKDNLVRALCLQQKWSEAEATCREANTPGAYRELGAALAKQQKLAEAEVPLHKAIELKSDYAVGYSDLGVVLHRQKKEPEAVAACRNAIKLDPNQVNAYGTLADALLEQKKLPEAAAALRRCAELDPKRVHWADEAQRMMLIHEGQAEQVWIMWEEKLKDKPSDQDAWHGYAQLCLFLGKETQYRLARRNLLDRFGRTTDLVVAERVGRDCLLLPASGKELRQAVTLIDRAVDFGPKHEAFRFFLFAKALAEYRLGNLDSAISLLYGPASSVLGPAPRLVLAMAQHDKGRKEEARKTLATAILAFDWEESWALDEGAWMYHVLRREAEALIIPNLESLLQGKEQPRDNDERVCLLGACQYQARYRRLAILSADAFDAEPKLVGHLRAGTRLRIAHSAALAAAGQGKDAANLEDLEYRRLSELALAWMRADLVAWNELLDKDPDADVAVREQMHDWQYDKDFVSVRDAKALAKLPEAERKQWEKLWREVEGLRSRASAPGLIQDWLILSELIPYEGKDGATALDAQPITCEAQLQPRVDDPAKGNGKVMVWKEHRSTEPYLDFAFILGPPSEYRIAYAVCYIHSAADRADLVLRVGSDDQALIYLNGEEVYRNARARPLKLDEDKTRPIKLHKGSNVLVFKVVNQGRPGPHGSLRLVTKDGAAAGGIVYRLMP
jgi:serine/threonine protein kinase/Flp pilus assembly protein TadD